MFPLDRFALWAIFTGTATAVFLAIEAGYRLGRRRAEDSKLESSVSAMARTTAGLLAFMLAFTFDSADSRHAARTALVIREANVIGTVYLRARVLEDPARTKAALLLRQYVDVRVAAILDPRADLPRALARSEALQERLWTEAAEAGRGHPASIPAGQFVQSLNEMIDLHLERVSAGYNRIGTPIWAALFFLMIMTMFMLGYSSGLAGSRSCFMALVMSLSFSAVILLIADLDRPHEGSITVSQQAMVDLKKTMARGEK